MGEREKHHKCTNSNYDANSMSHHFRCGTSKISSRLIFIGQSLHESSGRGFKIQLEKITMPLAESDVKIKLFQQKNCKVKFWQRSVCEPKINHFEDTGKGQLFF